MSDDLGKKIQQIAELLGQDNVPDNVKELVAMLASSMASKDGAADRNVPSTASSSASKDGTTDKNVPSAATSIEPAERNIPPVTPLTDDKPEKAVLHDLLNNQELMDTAKKAISRMNSGNDPRINLLHAIKPFMNSRRQKKIGNCIQLLQVSSLSRLLNEHDTNPR